MDTIEKAIVFYHCIRSWKLYRTASPVLYMASDQQRHNELSVSLKWILFSVRVRMKRINAYNGSHHSVLHKLYEL